MTTKAAKLTKTTGTIWLVLVAFATVVRFVVDAGNA